MGSGYPERYSQHRISPTLLPSTEQYPDLGFQNFDLAREYLGQVARIRTKFHDSPILQVSIDYCMGDLHQSSIDIAGPGIDFDCFPGRIYSVQRHSTGNRHMKLEIFISLIMMIGLASLSVQADNSDSSPSCSKPDKPDAFKSQTQLDGFNSEVQQYQRCLYDFVHEQEEAIQRHQRAANVAIDEWNNYVRMELN